ncbi:unnamed protein product [[Candida] boidinii]|uniref:Unnamed protein product n=1 Tax=Candida boidinii TaxID=5477 RepID=A0A9W6T8R6_CANBO|nr:unnamed protein product [[Candida] boidinii]
MLLPLPLLIEFDLLFAVVLIEGDNNWLFDSCKTFILILSLFDLSESDEVSNLSKVFISSFLLGGVFEFEFVLDDDDEVEDDDADKDGEEEKVGFDPVVD